jgi:hypothetical protein
MEKATEWYLSTLPNSTMRSIILQMCILEPTLIASLFGGNVGAPALRFTRKQVYALGLPTAVERASALPSSVVFLVTPNLTTPAANNLTTPAANNLTTPAANNITTPAANNPEGDAPHDTPVFLVGVIEGKTVKIELNNNTPIAVISRVLCDCHQGPPRPDCEQPCCVEPSVEPNTREEKKAGEEFTISSEPTPFEDEILTYFEHRMLLCHHALRLLMSASDGLNTVIDYAKLSKSPMSLTTTLAVEVLHTGGEQLFNQLKSVIGSTPIDNDNYDPMMAAVEKMNSKPRPSPSFAETLLPSGICKKAIYYTLGQRNDFFNKEEQDFNKSYTEAKSAHRMTHVCDCYQDYKEVCHCFVG